MPLNWLKKTAGEVRKAGTETLEMLGEAASDAIVDAVRMPGQILRDDGRTQVDTGDSGAGGTVYQAAPTGISPVAGFADTLRVEPTKLYVAGGVLAAFFVAVAVWGASR